MSIFDKISTIEQNKADKLNYLTGSELQKERERVLSEGLLNTSYGAYEQIDGKVLPFVGKTRNYYSDITNQGAVKEGLATTSGGFAQRYSGENKPGPLGVTPENGADLERVLPYDKATQLEYLLHSNKGMIENRAAGIGKVPQEVKDAYGAGYTEYYNPTAPLLDPTYQTSETPLPEGTYIPDQPKRYAPAGFERAEPARLLSRIASEYGSGEIDDGVSDPLNVVKALPAGVLEAGAMVAEAPKNLYEFLGGDYLEENSAFEKEYPTYSKAVKTIIDTMAEGANQIRSFKTDVLGYDDRNQKKLMESFGKAFDEGNYVTGIIGSVIENPLGVAELGANMWGVSRAMAAKGITGLPTIMGSFTDNANEARDIYIKEYGKEPTADELKVMAGLAAIGTAMDTVAAKWIFDKTKGDTASKAIGKAVGELVSKVPTEIAQKAIGGTAKIAALMGVEGFQEGFTEAAVVAGGTQDFEKFLDDKYKKRIYEAAAAGAVAGPGMKAANIAVEGTKEALTDNRRKEMIEKIKNLRKETPETTAEPIADVSSHWTDETDKEWQSYVDNKDLAGMKTALDKLNNAASTLEPEQVQELQKRIEPYLVEGRRLKQELADKYEAGDSEVKDVIMNSEPQDVLTYIKDDAKAEELAKVMRTSGRYSEDVINNALEARKDIKTLEEVRGSVVTGGLDEDRKGYINYYRDARAGNTVAKDKLYSFAAKHEAKSEAMKTQREEKVIAPTKEALKEIVNSAKNKISEEEALIALLYANHSLTDEGKTKYKSTYEKVKDLVGGNVLVRESTRGKNDIKIEYPRSQSGRNKGVFEVNYHQAPMELAVGTDIEQYMKPSPLSSVISAVDREVEAMVSLTDKLEGKVKAKEEPIQQPEKQEETPYPEEEVGALTIEEVKGKAKVEQPKQKETILDKYEKADINEKTAIVKDIIKNRPTPSKDIEQVMANAQDDGILKKVNDELAKEVKKTQIKKQPEQAKEEAAKDLEKEADIIEAEELEAQEAEPKTIETVTEKARPKKQLHPALNKLKSLGENTQFFEKQYDKIAILLDSKEANKLKGLNEISIAINKSEQTGKNAKLKKAVVREIQQEVDRLKKDIRQKYTKELNALKKEEIAVKELAKQIRKEMYTMNQALSINSRSLKEFKISSKDELTQQLSNERDVLVKELNSKEKGLRTSITIISKFLDKSITKPERKQELLKNLADIHERLGFTSEKKVTNLVSGLKYLSKLMSKISVKLANKVNNFINKLENSLMDVRVLRNKVKLANEALRGRLQERLEEAYVSEKEIREAIGESAPKYTNELLENNAYGTRFKKYTDISKKTREGILADKIKKDFISIKDLLDTKKVNSDFARYAIMLSEDLDLVSEVKKFANTIKSIIPENTKAKDRDPEEMMIKDYARALIFNVDNSIDENVAGSMLAAVIEELNAGGSKYLKMTPDEVSRMYGIAEEDLDMDTYNELSKLGVLIKYMTAELGKSTMELLGIKMKEGADSNQYDDLVSSLGNMAMYAAQKQGLVSITEKTNEELANLFDTVADKTEATTRFVKLEYGKLDKLKDLQNSVNNKLVIPSTKKNVRFGRRRFDEKDDCNGM
ncbi:MAG: hypothetical protein PVF17_02800 [Ignavibacteria bacterium]|jgi:hypothetical protein